MSCSPSILACADQHKVAKGLVNAFLNWKVLGNSGYKAWFDGTVQNPWGLEIWPQFSEGDWESRRVIDNFQDGEVGTSTMGGTLSVNGNLQAEVVDNWDTDLRSLHGPEDGFRLEVTHDAVSPSNILQWSIPAAKANASGFTHLSFRIGQDSAATGAARVHVRLRRGGAWSALVSSEDFGEIPEPDHMGTTFCLDGSHYPDRTVVHMRTIRIPLASFGGDLTNVQNVQIRFDDATTLDKVLYLDNLEFTGGAPLPPAPQKDGEKVIAIRLNIRTGTGSTAGSGRRAHGEPTAAGPPGPASSTMPFGRTDRHRGHPFSSFGSLTDPSASR